jgi:hypothetical protein
VEPRHEVLITARRAQRALAPRTVVEAEFAQAGVAGPGIGPHDRTALDARRDEAAERAGRGVGDHSQPKPPRARPRTSIAPAESDFWPRWRAPWVPSSTPPTKNSSTSTSS